MKNSIPFIMTLGLSLVLLSACENNGVATNDELTLPSQSQSESQNKAQAVSSKSPQDVSQLLLGAWQVESIQGKPVIDHSPARFVFLNKQQVGGSASCNNFSTYYVVSDNHLTLQPAAVTRKMCHPALMNQETSFLAGLAQVKRYQVEKGILRLFNENDKLIFKANRITKK